MAKHPNPADFPTTLWTVLAQTGEVGERGRAALHATVVRYHPALCVYLMHRHRLSEDDANDIAQSFIADKFLEQEIVRRADAKVGRFRSLLMASVDNYVISHARALNAAKRGKGATAEHISGPQQLEGREPDPSHSLDIVWARETINEVLRRMKAECLDHQRHDVWGIFESRVLAELLGKPLAELADLQQQYALRSPTQAVNLVVTGKRMFARLLRQVIGEYEPDPGRVDEEIAELRKVLREIPGFA